MASEESRQIRLWLIQNMKNAPPPSTLQEARAGLAALSDRIQLPPETRVVPVDAGGVPAQWISGPGAAGDKVMFCLHGGGYTTGTARSIYGIISRLAAATGCRALAVDYRLAPEHPFPAAIDDAVAAYRWLLDQGHPGRSISFLGVSSGGGLALTALITLRDAGVGLPACAVLLSPWTDLAGTGESLSTRAEADPVVTQKMNRFHAALYAGETDLRHPLVSPLYADLRGLPPLLIHVGSDEILLDDSIRLAERAKEAGVETTLDVWEGMWHVWHAFAPRLPEGVRAIDQAAGFIRGKWGG